MADRYQCLCSDLSSVDWDDEIKKVVSFGGYVLSKYRVGICQKCGYTVEKVEPLKALEVV